MSVCSDNFTDSAVSARLNGEHKEKDLEPWDCGAQYASGSLESLDNDLVKLRSYLFNTFAVKLGEVMVLIFITLLSVKWLGS